MNFATQSFKHRLADATITLLKPDGSPLANTEVTVAQKSHKFLFGTTGAFLLPLINDELSGEKKVQAQLHADRLLKLFNFVTLPFYWGRFEPTRGQPDTKRIKNAAKWFTDRGCVVKGHPLCWHTVSADWLLQLSDDQIIQAQRDRIVRDVKDFAGLIDMWDVINEVVIMPVFDKYDNGITRIAKQLGRVGVVKMTFDAARQTNPAATLLINDFDLSEDYEHLIEECLAAEIKIDTIGIQSHMHQGWWGLEKTHRILDRYSRFNLPLHFTETTLVSGHLMPEEIVDLNDYKIAKPEDWPSTSDGEARQAEQVEQHYKTLFAHPLVEAITWWGLNDGGWLNAPSGLLRIDQSEKPAFKVLEKLISQDWWMKPTKLTTDDAGRLRFSGCPGEYTISAGPKNVLMKLDEQSSHESEVRLPETR